MEAKLRTPARIPLFLGVLLACVFAPVGAMAAQSAAAPGPPPELLKMRLAFAQAAAAGDAEAAARLSRFPLDNLVGHGDRTLSRAAFLKRFRGDFTRHKDIVDCWLNDGLEMDFSNGKSNFRKWRLNCNGNIYSFALIDGHWSYTGYENINE
jgi:hypothetical protein